MDFCQFLPKENFPCAQHYPIFAGNAITLRKQWKVGHVFWVHTKISEISVENQPKWSSVQK